MDKMPPLTAKSKPQAAKNAASVRTATVRLICASISMSTGVNVMTRLISVMCSANAVTSLTRLFTCGVARKPSDAIGEP